VSPAGIGIPRNIERLGFYINPTYITAPSNTAKINVRLDVLNELAAVKITPSNFCKSFGFYVISRTNLSRTDWLITATLVRINISLS